MLSRLLHRRWLLLGMFVTFLGVIPTMPSAKPTLRTFLNTLPPQEKQNGAEEWDTGTALMPPVSSSRKVASPTPPRPPQRRWTSIQRVQHPVALQAVLNLRQRRLLPRRTMQAPPTSEDPDEEQI